MEQINIVVIRSLSYTGTTWVNAIMGSHNEVMYIGPPDRIWQLSPDQNHEACLLHRGNCTFWPDFIKNRNEEDNFFVQLAKYSGKSNFVINNPSKEFIEKELDPTYVNIHLFRQVRDPRANITSMLRHHPQRYQNIYNAINNWLVPALNRLFKYELAGAQDHGFIRYEDIIENPMQLLNQVGDIFNIEYSPDSLRYWEFDLHITAGNTGMIDSMLRLNKQSSFVHHRKSFYDQLIDNQKKDPTKPVIDNSWKDLFTQQDRFIMYYLCHAFFEKLGYASDEFSDTETQAYLKTLNLSDMNSPHPKEITIEGSNIPEQFFSEHDLEAKSRNIVRRILGKIKRVLVPN